MKTQKDVITSDWEGGKEFLTKTEHEDQQSAEDYYKDREHLFDLKAQKAASSSFLAMIPGWARFGGFIFFGVLLLSDLNFIQSIGVGAISAFVAMFAQWLKGVLFEGGTGIKYNPDDDDMHRSLSSMGDLVDRTFDINTSNKMFTDDRDSL